MRFAVREAEPCRGVEAAKFLVLTAMILCSLVVVVSMPNAHAANSVLTFYYGSTLQSGCSIRCEQLTTITGASDTSTTVRLGNRVSCCVVVQPDSRRSITATPST